MRSRVERAVVRLKVMQGEGSAFMERARRQAPVSCDFCEQPFCCNQVVAVSLLEAIAIVDWSDKHLRGTALRGKRDELEKQHRALMDPSMDQDRWYEQKVPCAFLSMEYETGPVCEIYSGRPTPCRTHLAVSPPELCDPDQASEGAFVYTREFARRHLDEEVNLHRRAKIPFVYGPLQFVLCAAIEYVDRGEQAMLDFLGPLRSPEAMWEAFSHLYHSPKEMQWKKLIESALPRGA